MFASRRDPPPFPLLGNGLVFEEDENEHRLEMVGGEELGIVGHFWGPALYSILFCKHCSLQHRYAHHSQNWFH